MDWSKGFEATFYACKVDRITWRDLDRFEIKDGTITSSEDALVNAADITTDYEVSADQWIRVYMDTRQEGAASHMALFTGLSSVPEKEIEWQRNVYKLECYSVLKPAEDMLLPRGYFLPKDMDGGKAIEKLLNATPAPVELDGSMPYLKNAIIAEQGETNLSMTTKVLQAINRRIRIKGDGTIQITKKAADPSATFDALENDCVEPTISVTRDWFSCPNVFRAISDSQVAVIRDNDPDSEFSIQARGREIWMEETNCNLSSGEGIAAYAMRRLKEEQAKGYEISYSRRFHPDVLVSDMVGLRYPGQGLNGNYRVIAQRITLGAGCRTEEQVEYS